MRLDVAANRQARKYSAGEMWRRVAWSVGGWLMRLSPRPCFGWRRWVLRGFGARVGREVRVYPGTRIYFPWNLRVGDWSAIGEDVLVYNLGVVVIGQRVTISHGAHLCAGTHDYRRADLPLLKPPIQVGDEAWICADAFVGPGVAVGPGAIVGARAVVMKDVPGETIVAGNPAVCIGRRFAADRR